MSSAAGNIDEAPVTRAKTELDALTELSVGETADLITSVPQAVVVQPDDTQEIAVVIEPAAVLQPVVPEPQTFAEPETQLEQLIVNALKQGQSTGYIDALVNDAASKGAVEVPQSLITQDGRVDTNSLLAVLSTPSRGESVATGSAQSYVVQAGDSLASISYRYYGSTSRAADIFSANRSILSTPNHVEVGQTLVIPAL